MGEHWTPSMAPVSDPEPEYIRMRRRSRHMGTPVGTAAGLRGPVTIDVAHLAWHDDADCQYVDPELFFPDSTPDPRAIEICNGCPVKTQCLDDAMADPRRMGIWGGTTNADRDRLHGTGRAVYQAEYRRQRAERAG